jgi:hypothetical protein
MLKFLIAALCAQAAFGFPGQHTGWSASNPQPIVNVEVPAGSQLPIFSVQAPPARVQEAIPQPIYSLHTSVQQPILGQQTVLSQRTLPIGASQQEFIRSMTQPQMVRQVQGKNMPVLEGPKAQNLPVQELPKQHENYPVKQQEQQKETVSQDVTQQVFAPHLQRIFRHAVPVRHINVNRYVQPIVNRVVQPVLETQVQEGKQQPARIAQKKGHGEGAAAPTPTATGAETPEMGLTGGAAEAEIPAEGAATGGFRTTMYRAGEESAAASGSAESILEY